MPRINKAIELLEHGQPVYYRRVDDPTDQNYDGGVRFAHTWADYIDYNMELAPFDIYRLREFIRGLVDGGPTAGGHRTPAVIVTMPLDGRNEHTIRANAWIIRQLLNTGVHYKTRSNSMLRSQPSSGLFTRCIWRGHRRICRLPRRLEQ